MSGDVALRRPRRRPRAVVMVPLASALILVVGWTALWGVARREALVGLDGFFAAEALHGRHWTCPDRDVTGFPLRIALSCREPAFSGVVDGSPSEGRLAALEAGVWLYEPSSVEVALTGPMALTSADHHADFTLDWTGLHATLRGLIGGMKRVEVLAENPSVVGPGGMSGRAERIELHAGPAAGTPAGAADDAVEIAVAGAALPEMDALTGEGAHLDGLFTGTVTRAYGDLPDLGVATVERWRRDGGRLDIANLTLTKGPLTATATGRLGLDGLHRLDGRLDTSLGGFDPLLKRFGISTQAAAVGGLLAGLLNPRATPAAMPVAGRLALPVVFADGGMMVGPFRTGLRMQPLY